jgi:hypothetical protein
MKVPSFKTEKIRDDIFDLIELAPTRSMYGIVLESIDSIMGELVLLREEISSDNDKVSKMLNAWDRAFGQFGEREAYYYQAFIDSEDKSDVDAPLFHANYAEFGFDPKPKWPDIETPWRLANELSTAALAAGKNQKFLDDMGIRFKNIITRFWETANSMIVKEKDAFEKQAAAESGDNNNGRVYGFWPLVAIGAVALVGAFGAAAGYTAASSDTPEDYVEVTPAEKHMKTAKTVGIGVLVGIALAVVLMLRIRK